MSACAGSSTELKLQFHLLCPPGRVRPTRTGFFEDFLPARSEWIAGPAGQGFMSTQRRDNRSTHAAKNCRWGPRYRWRRTGCTGRTEETGKAIPASNARKACADASGGTAPPGFPEWLATKSLQMGYRSVQLVQFVPLARHVRFVQFDLRHGSPPFGAGPDAETGTPAFYGSSLPHIPLPSGLARFHPTLPRVPAG
jgi:hypothetical protein